LDRAEASAINCIGGLPESVAGFIRDSLAENTRLAYLSDLREFERWGGSIPASAETLASYLAARAHTLAVASLVRHVASISKAHVTRGYPIQPGRNWSERCSGASGEPGDAPSARPSP
jgi:hypothetical protein